MSAPRLFVGGAGFLAEADSGFEDAGESYQLVARSNPIAPAGISGECIFTTVHVAVTFDRPFSIVVTPILDGTPIWDEAVELSSSNELSERQTHRWEIAQKITFYREAEPIFNHAMRGTWFAIEISMPCPQDSDGDLILEGFRVEHEIVAGGG